jgi:hypothetical protein
MELKIAANILVMMEDALTPEYIIATLKRV